MSDNKINIGLAVMKILESWGADTIYGIPSGTLSSLMDAMGEEENNV